MKNGGYEQERLNGKTPTEICVIKIKGRNKWLTLIQNVSNYLRFERKTINRELRDASLLCIDVGQLNGKI